MGITSIPGAGVWAVSKSLATSELEYNYQSMVGDGTPQAIRALETISLAWLLTYARLSTSYGPSVAEPWHD